MFIDDELRRALVDSAEKLGISASILLDWARAISEHDTLRGVILEMFLDGTLEVTGIRNQRPVFSLTKQGERVASFLQEDSAAGEFYPRLIASRPRGH